MTKSAQERAAALELEKIRIEAEGKAAARFFDPGKISPWVYIGVPAGLLGLFLILRR